MADNNKKITLGSQDIQVTATTIDQMRNAKVEYEVEEVELMQDLVLPKGTHLKITKMINEDGEEVVTDITIVREYVSSIKF